MNKKESKKYISALEAELQKLGVLVLRECCFYTNEHKNVLIYVRPSNELVSLFRNGMMTSITSEDVCKLKFSLANFTEVSSFLQEFAESKGYKPGAVISWDSTSPSTPQMIPFESAEKRKISFDGVLLFYNKVPILNLNTGRFAEILKVENSHPAGEEMTIAETLNNPEDYPSIGDIVVISGVSASYIVKYNEESDLQNWIDYKNAVRSWDPEAKISFIRWDKLKDPFTEAVVNFSFDQFMRLAGHE